MRGSGGSARGTQRLELLRSRAGIFGGGKLQGLRSFAALRMTLFTYSFLLTGRGRTLEPAGMPFLRQGKPIEAQGEPALRVKDRERKGRAA